MLDIVVAQHCGWCVDVGFVVGWEEEVCSLEERGRLCYRQHYCWKNDCHVLK